MSSFDIRQLTDQGDNEGHAELVSASKIQKQDLPVGSKVRGDKSNNVILSPSKTDTGKVYINKEQYFGNVPEIAWNFYIGGYQPAQK